MSDKNSVQIKDKYLQTIAEAAEYFGIGINKIREITDTPKGMECIVFNGTKRLIKRKKLEQYLDSLYEI